MSDSTTPTDEWPDPARLVCLVALVATHGLVRLAERYLPEFLSTLGYGPILVGTVLTLGLGTAVITTNRANESLGIDGISIAGLAALVTALGLLAWTGAPTLDTLLNTPISVLGWLAVGIVLLQAWHVHGPVRRLWPIDTRVVDYTSSANDHRKPTVVGALGVGAAAVFATAAVASAGGVRAGFTLVAATGAAVALVAAVALGTVDEESTLLQNQSLSTDFEGSTTADEALSLAAIWHTVTGLPDRQRWTLIGDVFVRMAIVGSSPYLILLVVEHQPIALSLGGLSLAPVAVFGLFVLAEALGAIVGTAAFPALDSGVDRHSVLTFGLAVLSLLPLVILVAPSSVGVVALLFALLGCRTVIEPLRPTVGAVSDVASDRTAVPGQPVPPTVRIAVQFVLVPAPLAGGILYAISPIAAFTLATTVGLLGVRELLRALAQKHYG